MTVDEPGIIHSTTIGSDGPIYPQNIPIGGRCLIVTHRGVVALEKVETKVCAGGVVEDRYEVIEHSSGRA